MRAVVASLRGVSLGESDALSQLYVTVSTLAVVMAVSVLSPSFGMGMTLLLLVGAALVDLVVDVVPDLAIALSSVGVLAASVAAGQPLLAFIGCVVCCAPLLVLHAASPGWCGFGDVKFAAPLGAVSALLGNRPIGGSLLLLAIASAVFVLACVLTRRTQLPFTPALVLGAIVALSVAPALFSHPVLSN